MLGEKNSTKPWRHNSPSRKALRQSLRSLNRAEGRGKKSALCTNIYRAIHRVVYRRFHKAESEDESTNSWRTKLEKTAECFSNFFSFLLLRQSAIGTSAVSCYTFLRTVRRRLSHQPRRRKLTEARRGRRRLIRTIVRKTRLPSSLPNIGKSMITIIISSRPSSPVAIVTTFPMRCPTGADVPSMKRTTS